MNHRAQRLEQFLDRSFARFRSLPSDGVDSACYRVLQRLRIQPACSPQVVEFQPRRPRRYGRLAVLIAATAAAVFAQQVATRKAVQVAPVKEEPVRVAQQVTTATQATPEPPKPAASPSRGKPEF